MVTRAETISATDIPVTNESSVSAVSWASIVAGAAVAAAASLLLVALGTGLGFASLSAWANEGPAPTTFTVMTAIWLIVVQWLASALGGYLTGRFRTKWVGTHTHEVFFRDTAHGFVTWSVATLATTLIVALTASAVISGGAKVASSVAAGAAQVGAGAAAGAATGNSYELDSLFRSTAANTAGPDVRAEAMRILAKGLGEKEISPADRTYLVDLIAARTGVSPEEAGRRIDNAVTGLKALEVKAREAAEAARKAASAASICTALAMLIGAFIACVAAALGGAQRDLHP
ncbi:MAG TPA: hypothetical protein VGN07_17530 [Steroidobacteraceae bacterium]|jgi:hypothetical protein